MFTYYDAYAARYYFENLRIEKKFRFHWHYNILEATLKNAYIAQQIENHVLNTSKKLKVLDMGCGTGHVSHWIVRLARVNTVGFDPAVNWKIKLINLKLNLNNRRNAIPFQSKLIKGNHLDFFRKNKYKFDLIVDNCSVTHFDTRPFHDINNGWFSVIQSCKELLNENGKLIVATDVCGQGIANTEFLDENSLKQSFIDQGWTLSCIDQIDSSKFSKYNMYLERLRKIKYERVPPIKTLDNGLLGITGFVASPSSF